MNPTPDMPLIDLALLHYIQERRSANRPMVSEATRDKAKAVCNRLKQMLGRDPLVRDLTVETLSLFAAELEAAKTNRGPLSDQTKELYRDHLAALLRYAGDKGIIDVPPEYQRANEGKFGSHPPCFKLSDEPGTLWHFCQHVYFPRNLRMRSKRTRECYMLALRKFGEYLGRQPALTDLDDDTVTAWTKHMLDVEQRSAYTIRERMGRVLSVWNWAAKRRKTTGVEEPPTVRRPEAPEPVPTALTAEQLRKLFTAARRLRGTICGIPAADWWSAWLAFIYNTAERYGAASQLKWEWVDLTTRVASIPAKVRKGGRKNAVYHLWPETVALLRKIVDPQRELVFPFDKDQGTYYNRYKRLLADAGLPTGRKYKTHSLRVSHATMRMVLGGDATAALMHSDPATTR
jgi:integrase